MKRSVYARVLAVLVVAVVVLASPSGANGEGDGRSGFAIEDPAGGRQPFQIAAGAPSNQARLVRGAPGAEEAGVSSVKIGVGTSTPLREIHVVSGDAPAFRLEQDGSGGFTPQTWEVIGQEINFNVHDLTAGTFPFKILTSAPEESLVIETDGVVVGGDFRAGSSREIKRDLEPAPAVELLADLMALDIFTWSFKADASGSRHVGPVAEDFYQRFGFGRDDKHISPADLAGLSLAAIQGLHQRLEEKDADIERLEAALAGLEQSLDAVKALLAERAGSY